MRKVLAVLAISLGAVACQPAAEAPTAAPAAPAAPAFAEAVCAGCHAIEPPFLSPNPQAPTFADIANQRGLDVTTLSTWLRDAHNYPEAMEFTLDVPEADALARYIVTLKSEDYKPPI